MPAQNVFDWSFSTDGTANVYRSLRTSFIFVYKATSEFSISVDNGAELLVKQGSLITFLDSVAESIAIKSSSAQDIILKHGLGRYTEQSIEVSIDPDTPTLDVLELNDTNGEDVVDQTVTSGAAAVILAASSFRSEAFIKLNNANTGTARVTFGAGATPTATTGVEMAPGDTIVTRNQGAIKAHAIGADATFSITVSNFV
jgi:hypothetical protein